MYPPPNLDYAVVTPDFRTLAFISCDATEVTAKSSMYGFAMAPHADFHAALHLHMMKHAPDVLHDRASNLLHGTTLRSFVGRTGKDAWTMKFNDFAKLWILHTKPTEAVRARLRNKDPVKEILGINPDMVVAFNFDD